MKAKQEAPVVFAFVWPATGGFPAMDNYNLTADIPNHPKRSTLSSKTLLAEGYSIPAAELAKAKAAMAKEVV